MKVLIVDDVKFTITFLQRVLEKDGHSVITAEDGNSAIKQLKSNPDIGLVLIDQLMPDMNGTDVFMECQKLDVFNGIDAIAMPPFLLMTTDNSIELEQQSLDMGFKRFLRKPIEPNLLIESIASLKSISDDEQGLKLLVADGKGATHDWLSNMLDGTNHQVVHSNNARGILDHVEEHRDVSIVIAEYDLDDMTGPTLFKRLRALQFKLFGDDTAGNLLPFLLIVDRLDPDLLKEIREAGIKDVMPKPLDMALMAEKLSKLNKGKASMKSKAEQDAVLVVDDVGFNQVVVERMLKSDGLNVIKAQSSYDAIELFKTKGAHIKAVVCDLMMPGMDGVELFQYIQKSDYNKPEFILITASNDSQRMDEARRMGFFEVLQKPLNPTRIKELVHKVVAGKTADEHHQETATPVTQ
jgi:CheY-like chemotaxis protein